MKEIIAKLDKWLKKNRPDYYKNLNSGLSDEEIIHWEKQFGFEFPEDFKMLYQWKNGQKKTEQDEGLFDADIFDEMKTVHEQWTMFGDDLLDLNEEDNIAWGESWLPFMRFRHNSNSYCLDVKGELGKAGSIVYLTEDAAPLEVMFSNLQTMLEMIINQFEEDVYAYIQNKGKFISESTDDEKRREILRKFMAK